MSRRDDDVLLLLASDGLWDVFNNQEARNAAVTKWVLPRRKILL